MTTSKAGLRLSFDATGGNERQKEELSRFSNALDALPAGMSRPEQFLDDIVALARLDEGKLVLKMIDKVIDGSNIAEDTRVRFCEAMQHASKILFDLKDAENSILILTRWQTFDPDNPVAVQILIETLQDVGLQGEADRFRIALLERHPDARGYLIRAQTYWDGNNAEMAMLDILRSLALDPICADALNLPRQMAPGKLRRHWKSMPARRLAVNDLPPTPPRLQIVGFHNSGVSWITTVLFQLGFYVTRRSWGHWVDLRTGKITLSPDHGFAMRSETFPAFEKRTIGGQFNGIRTVSIEGGHNWPSPLYFQMDTVLIYRNVMSVLWSMYKRRVVTASTDGLTLRGYFDQHMDAATGLGMPDKWALYHLLWINLYRGKNLLLLSYDHGKKFPVGEIGAILSIIGETRTESEIMDAVRASQLDKAAIANPSLTALQVGRGSTDDYLNVFSDEDEKWVRGLPRKMWNYFEGSWDGRVVDMTFAALLNGLDIFGGTVAPEIAELCEAGSFDVAHTRAVNLSSGRDANAVFVLAIRSAINLTDNFLSEEIDSFTEPEFECAFKVFLFAFQDLMAPNLMLMRASATLKRHHNPIVLQHRSVPMN